MKLRLPSNHLKEQGGNGRPGTTGFAKVTLANFRRPATHKSPFLSSSACISSPRSPSGCGMGTWANDSVAGSNRSTPVPVITQRRCAGSRYKDFTELEAMLVLSCGSWRKVVKP
jgi:hypothetical protein